MHSFQQQGNLFILISKSGKMVRLLCISSYKLSIHASTSLSFHGEFSHPCNLKDWNMNILLRIPYFLRKLLSIFWGKSFWRKFCQILIEFEKRIGGNRDIRQFTRSLPCLWACFHRLSTLSVVSAKSKEILLKTQHLMHKVLRLTITIVVVQVGAVKIYVAAVEALRKKER